MNKNERHEAPRTEDDDEIRVFIAAPITERAVAEILEPDTPEVTAARQNILNIITGHKRQHGPA